jgi:CheY-like chemotaxis protein
METILIVDDQPDIRYLLRLILEDEGFHCLEASDGEMAIQMLTDHSLVHLLVTDFQMPRINGLQLLNYVKTHPTLRNIPVIFITAEHSLDLRNTSLQAGAHQVLFKPFDYSELKACVQALFAPQQAA